MSRQAQYCSLILIVILAGVLRFLGLSARPLGFTWDEAALGYNAYSLIQTGRDEWSVPAPVVFTSFGDYKPGLYIYLATPFIAISSLNQTTTRLPSAVMGTLGVVMMYVLTRRLVRGSKGKNVALVVGVLFAINPWSIHFSRGAWEANVWLTLTLVALNLWLSRRFCWSAVFFGLTLLTYQGGKLLTPLLMTTLFISFRPRIRQLIIPAGIFLLIILPILIGFGSQSGRLKVFSLFSYTRNTETVENILAADRTTVTSPIYMLFHTEFLNQIRGFAQRYYNHLSPRFLFIDGDWSNLRQSTPYYGNFHLPEALSIAVGIGIVVASRRREAVFIGIWLLISPLPSALSRDIVSGVRSLPLVAPLTIVSGLGVYQLCRRRIRVPVVVSVFSFFTIYFLDAYFVHAPFYASLDWLSPVKPAVELALSASSTANKVIISDKFGQPYIFVLFYSRYSPRQFQQERSFTASEVGDVGAVHNFGKFEFRPIYWPADRGLPNTVFVGDQFQLPPSDLDSTVNLSRLGVINYPNGAPGLAVVKTE